MCGRGIGPYLRAFAPEGLARVTLRLVDTFLAIASRREVRSYEGRPIPDDVVRRILDAGRLSGSGGNRQPWRFVLVSEQAQAQAKLADAVFEPDNVRGAPLDELVERV